MAYNADTLSFDLPDTDVRTTYYIEPITLQWSLQRPYRAPSFQLSRAARTHLCFVKYRAMPAAHTTPGSDSLKRCR